MSSNPTRTDQQTVVFELGEEQFGVDIFRVNEIIRLPEVTQIPKTDPNLMGLVNLRGENIPVIDLKGRLGLAGGETTDRARIIVIEGETGHTGILVDQVQEVITLKGDQIERAPSIAADPSNDFIVGVARHNDSLISLLDLDQVLAA